MVRRARRVELDGEDPLGHVGSVPEPSVINPIFDQTHKDEQEMAEVVRNPEDFIKSPGK